MSLWVNRFTGNTIAVTKEDDEKTEHVYTEAIKLYPVIFIVVLLILLTPRWLLYKRVA